jgi:hypothetical protein
VTDDAQRAKKNLKGAAAPADKATWAEGNAPIWRPAARMKMAMPRPRRKDQEVFA